MMKRCRLVGLFVVIALLYISLSIAFGQYETSKTSVFTISSSGVANVAQDTTVGGVSIVIAGRASSTGSVSTATYTGNPQPGASKPANVTLTDFVAITFNLAADNFQNATITISYNAAEVTGINPPYSLYKYVADSNSYIALNGVVDTSAKTITTTVTSIDDPLFAIGGTTAAVPNQSPAPSSGIPAWIWISVVVISGVIVVTAVLALRRRLTKSST